MGAHGLLFGRALRPGVPRVVSYPPPAVGAVKSPILEMEETRVEGGFVARPVSVITLAASRLSVKMAPPFPGLQRSGERMDPRCRHPVEGAGMAHQGLLLLA